jgi:hypothetical protein
MPRRIRVLHPSTPQSLIFYKVEWTVAQAKAWLEEHGFKHGKVDRRKNTLRFRQFDPKLCLRGTYGTKTWISRSRSGKKVLATMCRVSQRVAKGLRATSRRKTARRRAA